MTIYKKLIEARKLMGKLERSGKNAHRNTQYTTLEDIYNICLEPLLEQGIYVEHSVIEQDLNYYLVTKIIDSESLDFISSKSKLNMNFDIQQQGAELTYYKRYHLTGLLSIRSDFDDDGESLVKEKATKLISAKQIALIKFLLSKLPVGTAESFLKHYNIEEIEGLEFYKADEAIRYLKTKVEKGDKQ